MASTIRPEGVFAYHSALELLGVGHSSWNRCTLLVERRRRPLSLDGTELRFLGIPKPMRESRDPLMGTRRIEYRGRLLRVTGPERTLVEGMGRLDLCGGPEEHVVSASGFPTLDLDLLLEVLRCYRQQLLWAAVGWFLERYQEIFHVPDAYLERLARRRPRTPRYLERNSRGGRLLRRWNLIVPEELECSGGPREP